MNTRILVTTSHRTSCSVLPAGRGPSSLTMKRGRQQCNTPSNFASVEQQQPRPECRPACHGYSVTIKMFCFLGLRRIVGQQTSRLPYCQLVETYSRILRANPLFIISSRDSPKAVQQHYAEEVTRRKSSIIAKDWRSFIH